MTQQTQLPYILLASVLAAFAAGAFLLPSGAGLAHLAYLATIALVAGNLAALAYARLTDREAPLRNESLRPSIEWYVTRGRTVPASLLAGSAPLIALVAEGQVPHPELVATLAPYFADPAVAFVQGAMRWDGAGGVASAFRLASALGDFRQQGRDRLNAVEFTGTGALLSREALRAAWQPGDTWATLGMRLQALGYAGHFEPQAMSLVWAPLTMSEFSQALMARTRTAAEVGLRALTMRGLPLAARLQYAAAAAAPLATWAAAAMGTLSAFSLVLLDSGPVITTSPAALPGALTALACSGLALWAFYKLSGINPVRPTALMLAGAYTAAGEAAYRALTSAPMRRAARGAWAAARAAAQAATAPRGGSADTAPVGTPARS